MHPIEFVCGDEGFGIVLAMAEENIDPIDNWSHFIFIVCHKSNVLQGNVYINAQGEREQFVTAIKEWLRRFRVAVPAQKKAKEKEKSVMKTNETAVSSETVNQELLLKRAFMFLEDGNWSSADEYCEKVLDIDPENASAYLGKLLSSQRACKLEDLKEQEKPFDGNVHYQKVLRFGDESIQETLKGYIEQINLRNEETRKDALLAEGKAKMTGEDICSYESAVKLFESISGWKDADEKRNFCQKKIEEIKAREEEARLEREREAELAQKKAKRIARRNKWATGIIAAVSAATIFWTVQDMFLTPEKKYNEAVTLMENGELLGANQIFGGLHGYKGSYAKAQECWNKAKYAEATDLMENGDVEEAYEIFAELDDYEDSADKAAECEKEITYKNAVALMEAEELSDSELNDAYEAFQNLGWYGYKDSAEKAEECKLELDYRAAEELMENGDFKQAQQAFTELDGYRDSAEKTEKCKQEIMNQVNVGDTILFGAYEQDNDMDNGKEAIEWLVLAKEDGKMLVVSQYGLDVKKYNEEYTEVTWENCSLRQWLNSDFVDAAFTEEEKERIPTVTVPADENSYTSIDPGNATQDQVFLLSMSEVLNYLNLTNTKCNPTDYTVTNNVVVSEGNSWWWLRTPGRYQNRVVIVGPDGSTYYNGHEQGVSGDGIAVRPAMWINIESGNTEE